MATAADIPVIDISSPDQAKVARDLVEAAARHGFIYIKNTGSEIPVEQIDGIFDTVCPHSSWAVLLNYLRPIVSN